MRFLSAVLFLLAGCVAAQPTTPVTQTFVYHCDCGKGLTVRKAGEMLWFFLLFGIRQLKASSSERGRLYRNTGIEFWKKDEDAPLNIAGRINGTVANSMSGAMFNPRVTLDLDGQILYGCGRSLH